MPAEICMGTAEPPITSLGSGMLTRCAPLTRQYMTAETKAHFALGMQAIRQNVAAYLSFWRQCSQHQTDLGFSGHNSLCEVRDRRGMSRGFFPLATNRFGY